MIEEYWLSNPTIQWNKDFLCALQRSVLKGVTGTASFPLLFNTDNPLRIPISNVNVTHHKFRSSTSRCFISEDPLSCQHLHEQAKTTYPSTLTGMQPNVHINIWGSGVSGPVS